MSGSMKLLGAIAALEQLLTDHQRTYGASERPFRVVESADINAQIDALKQSLHARQQVDENAEKEAATDALSEYSASPVVQKDALLAFVLQQQLGHEFQAFLEAQPPKSISPADFFLQDVAQEIGTLIPWAQEKAQKALHQRQFDATPFYPAATNARIDKTALKCFLHALWKEISFQYRPLSESKKTAEMVRQFTGVM